MKVKVWYRMFGQVEINIPDEVEYNDERVKTTHIDSSDLAELVEDEFWSLSDRDMYRGIDIMCGDPEITTIVDENDKELWSI